MNLLLWNYPGSYFKQGNFTLYLTCKFNGLCNLISDYHSGGMTEFRAHNPSKCPVQNRHLA